jgi:hypothetical protein
VREPSRTDRAGRELRPPPALPKPLVDLGPAVIAGTALWFVAFVVLLILSVGLPVALLGLAAWYLPYVAPRLIVPLLKPDGTHKKNEHGEDIRIALPDSDSGIYVRGSAKSQVNIWTWPVGSGEVYGYRTDPNMPSEVRAGVTPKVAADNPIGRWNRFIITMKGDRLTVDLNGQTVLENAQLPGIAERGRALCCSNEIRSVADGICRKSQSCAKTRAGSAKNSSLSIRWIRSRPTRPAMRSICSMYRPRPRYA